MKFRKVVNARKCSRLCAHNSTFKPRKEVKSTLSVTRMVHLPATAAIEYVAAGHFFPGVFCPGALLAGRIFVGEGFCPGGGAFVRGGLCPYPQFQCVYEPSRLSVDSIIYVYPAVDLPGA